VFDQQFGLFYGESPILGGAGVFYPGWMQSGDVSQSPVLRTNVVHYRTYRIPAQMATVLGKFPDQWERRAQQVKQGINEHLWRPDAGRYAAYRYGGVYGAPTVRSDAVGSALVVLSGVTGRSRARRVARNQPVVDAGVPTLWPVTADTTGEARPAFHPIVTAYWTWASAAAQNTPAVAHGLASLYRAAALGRADTSEGDTSRLASAAGLLSTVYRVFFGMRGTADGLVLAPFVPAAYSGTHTLEGVPYRDATLDITVKGHGTRIVQVTLDGTPLERPVFPPDLTGPHEVRVLLSGGLPDGGITRAEPKAAPPTPVVRRVDDGVGWAPIETATHYRIVHNGRVVDTTAGTHHVVAAGSTLTEVQIQAVGESGAASFRSEPVRVIADAAVQVVSPRGARATEYEGDTGTGSRRRAGSASDSLAVTVPDSGRYALDFRYADGHGAGQAGRPCASRRVAVDGERVGTAVLPPRRDGAGTDGGYSSVLRLSLGAGAHTVVLSPEGRGEEKCTLSLDHLRLTPLSGGKGD